MRLLVKAFGILVLVVLCAVVVIFIMGARLPVEHLASVSSTIAAPQAQVWQLIEDVNKQPTWRTGLVRIEHVSTINGRQCWTEVQNHMSMPLCEVAVQPPAMRVVTIASASLPFGGTWTYELQAIDANSTHLVITENGVTNPAFFRFIGHYIYHEDTMIKQYESDVQKAVARP
jgi:hypothetical protein